MPNPERLLVAPVSLARSLEIPTGRRAMKR
jgi:hypothetical protein